MLCLGIGVSRIKDFRRAPFVFTVCIVQLHQSLNKFEWQRFHTHDDDNNLQPIFTFS